MGSTLWRMGMGDGEILMKKSVSLEYSKGKEWDDKAKKREHMDKGIIGFWAWETWKYRNRKIERKKIVKLKLLNLWNRFSFVAELFGLFSHLSTVMINFNLFPLLFIDSLEVQKSKKMDGLVKELLGKQITSVVAGYSHMAAVSGMYKKW
jgi:hypothetical protein